MGPLFDKFENRKSCQKRGPYKNRDLGPRFRQNTEHVLCIQDYQYKNYSNLYQNWRLNQLDTKKMSRMISNCPIKKHLSTSIQARFFSVQTIVPYNRKNRENRKLTEKQRYFLKLYIKSGSNKPHKLIRWRRIW